MLRIQGFNPSLKLNCSQRNSNIERNIGNTQPETDNLHFKSISNLTGLELKVLAKAKNGIIKGNEALSGSGKQPPTAECIIKARGLFQEALECAELLPQHYSKRPDLIRDSKFGLARSLELIPSNGSDALANYTGALSMYRTLSEIFEPKTPQYRFVLEAIDRVTQKMTGLNISEISIFA